MSGQQTGIAFSFKRNDHIGEAEAEFDEEFWLYVISSGQPW
jgi:hypothetical protein